MGENVKHTAGPWAISGRTSTCIRTADQEQRIAYMETADNTIETCVANARLIAAAPELLEALKGILSDIEEYQEINKLGGKDNHWQVISRTAIAKAEGE